jgi:hypothetical protein
MFEAYTNNASNYVFQGVLIIINLPLGPTGTTTITGTNLTLINIGNLIPVIGLGTFGSEHVEADTVAKTVLNAASIGYRHFDCASVYADWCSSGRFV